MKLSSLFRDKTIRIKCSASVHCVRQALRERQQQCMQRYLSASFIRYFFFFRMLLGVCSNNRDFKGHLRYDIYLYCFIYEDISVINFIIKINFIHKSFFHFFFVPGVELQAKFCTRFIIFGGTNYKRIKLDTIYSITMAFRKLNLVQYYEHHIFTVTMKKLIVLRTEKCMNNKWASRKMDGDEPMKFSAIYYDN